MSRHGVARGMVRAARYGRPLGAVPIEEKNSHSNDIFSHRHPSTPGISYKCKVGEHTQCSKSNCTCSCGHPWGK